MRASKVVSVKMRVAFLEGSLRLVPNAAQCLHANKIQPIVIDNSETVLRTLVSVPEAWDVVVYPISTRWQQGLEFLRAMRRIRECAGGQPCSPVLILSTTVQHPTTVDLFRRTSGTRYLQSTSPGDLACILEAMRQESFRTKQEARKLHVRLVHIGNPAGIGCTRDEQLSSVYVSFQPGQERQVKESPSVLHFLNLLAMNHWRFRTAPEIIQLMRQSPFYTRSDTSATVVSVNSIKTYVARVEAALAEIWQQVMRVGAPPIAIAREARGGRMVAYRLMATSEIDHV